MPTAIVTKARVPNPVGGTIPAHSLHGISVSLPSWADNIAYEEGDARVIDRIKSAYPRFTIHYLIKKLEAHCERKFGRPNEKCHLYPSATVADACRDFIRTQSPDPVHPIDVRIVRYTIHPPEALNPAIPTTTNASPHRPSVDLHIVFVLQENDRIARSFWQHAGAGISSRLAEYCLALLALSDVGNVPPSPKPAASPVITKPRHRHYSSLQKGVSSPKSPVSPSLQEEEDVDAASQDWSRFIEERYARNLPFSEAPMAKRQLRRRIAGVLAKEAQGQPETPEEKSAAVTEDDVFLFPCGMNAIWNSHKVTLGASVGGVETPGKSICFGFPYTDTLKILQKWGPGCHFFGHGLTSDLPALRALLSSTNSPSSISDSPSERITAVYCEFPSNPLLRSPPLVELRELANEFGFIIVVDETIGSFANVEVLPLADIVVSSLSKVFSGEVNVLGGALVLNPAAPQYHRLKASISRVYEDNYWFEDAVFMERNSRDYAPRVLKMNKNTEALCDFLRGRSLLAFDKGEGAEGLKKEDLVVTNVYYPKWETRENYDACRIGSVEQVTRSTSSQPEGGFGSLFTVTFTSELASSVFYDNLPTEKGPSLGTNFTLASPYAILAHYTELDWAAEYGVERTLVRVSVGLEEEEELLEWFSEAVKRAEEACRNEKATQAGSA
ncbi:PLP-dependent transferase [Clavulina sp. PMI_390]|nr:PLP-dependent transferase [Clavulina sp. PMI_390]